MATETADHLIGDVSAQTWHEREFLEPEVETASRAEIADLQQSRLLDLVPYAWENSAFYRAHWSAAGVGPDDIRSLSDIVKLPTFGKDDVVAYRERTGDPYGGLLCVPAGELVSITSTSGTTSEPELFPELWDVAPPLPTASSRDLWELGLRPGDRVMVPTGTFRNYWDRFYHMLGLVPVFVDTWLGQGEEMIKAIERHQIAYLQLLMPTVLEFERLEGAYDLKSMLSSLKGASFAGQPLGSVLLRKVREEWGINLFTYTSAGDTGTAWEGREHDGFQLWEDTIIPESLDAVTGRPVGDRAIGEFVATDLDNWSAPYIRFRTGDLVRITREPAPSGRTHARMWLLGRRGDETIVGGRAIVQSELWALIESHPELSDGMFQIVRYGSEMSTLRLRVGYEPRRTGDVAELRERLATHITAELGVTPEIELMELDQILTFSSSVAKFPRVVSK